jgi:hypothetical protein
MPLFSSLTGSGSGLIASGSSVGVLYIELSVTVFGSETYVVGPATFPRIYKAGWIGLGYVGPFPTYDDIVFSSFIKHPYQEFRIYPLQAYADSYFYDLDPGVEIDMYVIY